MNADNNNLPDKQNPKEYKEPQIYIDATRKNLFSGTMNIENEMLHFDFTKTHFSQAEFAQIRGEMEEKGMLDRINGMFSGEKINFSEDRKVLHTILRDDNVLKKILNKTTAVLKNERNEVYHELLRIKEFCEEIRSKTLLGVTDQPIDTIVNIGIGGSDLGPRMICEALYNYRITHIKSYFVSNIDPAEMDSVFQHIDCERTLFVIVSKTFSTIETLSNAKLATQMFMDRLEKAGKSGIPEEKIRNKHFVAVSSNVEACSKFGINRVFSMWDYVGGRYSLWSAAGLVIPLYIGFDHFIRLLRGASEVDMAFKNDPLRSMPMTHAISEIFYGQRGYNNKCIVNYDYYMRNFYRHIQQVDMESNGKTAISKEEKYVIEKTDKKTGKTNQQTGMIIWGGVGTDTQHSFFQLIHQGSHKILVEFIGGLIPYTEFKTERSHHTMLMGNCFAQSEALLKGRKNDNPHKDFEGNKPSITILYSRLTPETLGALIAHYEHKIFLQGIYFEINSFDQFGVQLGKDIANEILLSLENGSGLEEYSLSTKDSINLFRKNKQ